MLITILILLWVTQLLDAFLQISWDVLKRPSGKKMPKNIFSDVLFIEEEEEKRK